MSEETQKVTPTEPTEIEKLQSDFDSLQKEYDEKVAENVEIKTENDSLKQTYDELYKEYNNLKGSFPVKKSKEELTSVLMPNGRPVLKFEVIEKDNGFTLRMYEPSVVEKVKSYLKENQVSINREYQNGRLFCLDI